jgi:hypothetical protein
VIQAEKKTRAAAFALDAPANALHDASTKQLELGAVTVILHAYPDRLPTEEDGNELIRRQVAALRQFADMFEQALSIPLESAVAGGGSS